MIQAKTLDKYFLCGLLMPFHPLLFWPLPSFVVFLGVFLSCRFLVLFFSVIFSFFFSFCFVSFFNILIGTI